MPIRAAQVTTLILGCALSAAGADGNGPDWSQTLAEHAGTRIDESVVDRVIHVAVEADPTRADGSAAHPFPAIASAMAAAVAVLSEGIATKVSIGPGVYREDAGHHIFAGRAVDTLLVIEGAGPGKTVLSGADRWPLASWRAEGEGVYSRAWPFAFGLVTPSFGQPRTLGQRSEMAFLDGRPLVPVELEIHDYQVLGRRAGGAGPRPQRWTYQRTLDPARALSPGSFGVVESAHVPAWADRIWLRLPEGSRADPEVSVRGRLLGLGAKRKLVIRGIAFERSAACGGSDQEPAPPADRSGPLVLDGPMQDLLIEDCRFSWNNGRGLSLSGSGKEDPRPVPGRNLTLRRCAFTDNGLGGVGIVACNQVLIEHCITDRNGWRGLMGGETGYYFAGIKFGRVEDVLLRDHRASGNLCAGIWFDIHCARIAVQRLAAVLNERSGLFLEISPGPFLVDRSLLALNREHDLRCITVTDVTLRRSVFWRDGRAAADLLGSRSPSDRAFSAVESYWYDRDTPHARMVPLAAGPIHSDGCLFGGRPGPGEMLIRHTIRKPSEHERWRRWDWQGAGNRYLAEGDRFISSVRSGRPLDLAGWWSAIGGADGNALSASPFRNPARADFTPVPQSDLPTDLPDATCGPESLAAMRAIRQWAQAADAAAAAR